MKLRALMLVVVGLVTAGPVGADAARQSDVLVDVRGAAASGATLFVATSSVRTPARWASYDPAAGRMLDWPAVRSSGRVNISAVASDESGGWFIGGSFESVGGIDLPGFAHVNRDRRVDRRFQPPTIVVPTEIVVGPRLVFARSREGRMIALDRETGHSVWIPGYHQRPCTFIELDGSRLVSYELSRSGPRIVERSLIDGHVVATRAGRHPDPSWEYVLTTKRIGRFTVTYDNTKLGVVLRVAETGRVFRRYPRAFRAIPFKRQIVIIGFTPARHVSWTIVDEKGGERSRSSSRLSSFGSFVESHGKLWGCATEKRYGRHGLASITPESGTVRWIEDVDAGCLVAPGSDGRILIYGMRSHGPYAPGGLAAFDVQTLRQTSWRAKGPNLRNAKPLSVLVDAGVVYLLASDRVTAYDEHSGAPRWSVPNTVADNDPGFSAYRGSMAVRDGRLIVSSALTLRSFEASTGRLQWQIGNQKNRGISLVYLGSQGAYVSVLANGALPVLALVDLATGALAALSPDQLPGPTCGSQTIEVGLATVRTRELGASTWTTLTDQLASEKPSEIESGPYFVGCDAKRLYVDRILAGDRFQLVAIDRTTGTITRVTDGSQYFGPTIPARTSGIFTIRRLDPQGDQREQPTTIYQLVRIDSSNFADDRTAPVLGRSRAVLLVETDAGAVMIIDPAQNAGPQGGLFGVDD